MKITERDGRIFIDTPYNPNFVEKLKWLGGKWNPNERVWVMDARNSEAVREAMREVYGRDDRPVPLVSVRITTDTEISGRRGPVTFFGRIVASAWGRDTGARIGEGVAFEKGKPDSGGSAKNWCTVVPKDCVIVIHDVPADAVEQELDWASWCGTYEIIQLAIDQDALERERETLLARIAEIDNLLGGQ